jgi:hypothetical protein
MMYSLLCDLLLFDFSSFSVNSLKFENHPQNPLKDDLNLNYSLSLRDKWYIL